MREDWLLFFLVIIATAMMIISLVHMILSILTGRAKKILLALPELAFDFVIFRGIYDLMSPGGTSTIIGSLLQRREEGPETLLVISLLLLVLSILHILSIQYVLRSTVTPFSVGEAMDRVPEGIMFFLENGEVIQSNARMDRLAMEWTGRPLFNARALRDGSIPDEKIVERGEPMIIAGEGEQRWQLSVKETDLSYQHKIYELLAIDVSEEDKLLHQLNKQISDLERVNAHLREYSDIVDETVRKEELLEAKRRVHGNMGSDLLAVRVLLEGGKSPVPVEDILEQWKRNVRLLQEEGKEEKAQDPTIRLREAAAFLDIDLQLMGSMPEDPDSQELISIAIQECLTNAMQHAGADQLYVVISQDEEMTRLTISNNGNKAEFPIREGGGLSTLRKLAENQGAVMNYVPGGRFRMEMQIPKKYARRRMK